MFKKGDRVKVDPESTLINWAIRLKIKPPVLELDKVYVMEEVMDVDYGHRRQARLEGESGWWSTTLFIPA